MMLTRVRDHPQPPPTLQGYYTVVNIQYVAIFTLKKLMAEIIT
jgi:hypothetical protein